MEERRSRRPLLIGLSLAALAAVLILPVTRWLVRTHLRMQAQPVLGDLLPRPTAPSEIAARFPNDLQIQLAYEISRPPEAGKPSYVARRERLQALLSRFPDQPSLYANHLRYMTTGEASLHRDEASLFEGETPSSHHSEQPTRTEAVAEFESAAATGERLDPDNAYFPFMRSIGLFNLHRDAEALAAIQRAGDKPRWEEYYQDDAEGSDRMLTEAQGESGALQRISISAAILFPHYASLCSVARTATYLAAEAERTGDVDKGLAIRHGLMRCGSLMRIQSRSVIGSLVGIATSRIATRPGGSPSVTIDPRLSEAQRLQLQDACLQRYCAYLRRAGHEDEAHWVAAEIDAGKQVKELLKAGFEREPIMTGGLAHLGLWWGADVIVLSNLLGILALGAAAALAARVKLKKGLKPARILLGLFVFGGLFLWQQRVYQSGVSPFLSLLGMLSNSAVGDDAPAFSLPVMIQNAALFLGLIGPLTLLVTIAAVSRHTGVPAATGLGRGLRGLAVPIAAVLFLVYCGLLPGTLRQEAVLNDARERQLQHEGRYLAELVGKPWPGPTEP